jgi:single-strand DNA-binding protein
VITGQVGRWRRIIVNDIHVTLRGNVASELRQMCFDDGNTVTSFRMASNARRYDRDRREWVDKGTTYVRVTCRRAMALNAVESVRKGQPVVVTGRLRERFWSSDGRSGQSLEVEAETLGHDLSFGTATFVRVVRTERNDSAKDREDAEMAYLGSKDAEGDVDRVPTDVTGLTVLDDDDRDYEPDRVDELVARLPDPAVA